MAKLTLQDVSSGYYTTTQLNENNALIEAAMENTLSRDGTTPNSMEADLDMDSNDILNVNSLATQALTIAGTSIVAGSTLSVPDATNVPFTQQGTGAVLRDVDSKLQEWVSIKDFGAVGNGTTDDTDAIQAANAAAYAAGASLYFPAGTYSYDPSAVESIYVNWYGESYQTTIINCETSSYTGVFFRMCGANRISDIKIKTNGRTKLGTGVQLSNTDTDAFTGHISLDRLFVDGFDKNIDCNNIYMLKCNEVRSQYGTENFYCAPVDEAGDNGYITTHLHVNCVYYAGVRNVYYNPEINSPNVTFLNCSFEQASGASQQAYFNKIRRLYFINYYGEGSNTIPNITVNNCYTLMEGGYFNGTGGMLITGNNRFRLYDIQTTSATDLLVCTASASDVYGEIDNSLLQASGNDISGIDTGKISMSSINGTTYTEYVIGAHVATSYTAPTFTGLTKKSVTTGITADVGSAQGGSPLTTDINEVSTVGTTGDSVTLPTAVAGLEVTIINNGANACDVFPASGDNLGAGLNTAASLAAGTNITYVAYDATNWEVK